MKSIRPVRLLWILGLAACGDGSTGPAPLASVSILSESVALEERTLAAGATLQLTAELKNSAGKPAEGKSASWTSTNPAVASVSATGLVTALSTGSTRVIASAGGFADTMRINVATAVQGAVACEPGQEAVRLGVGETRIVTADQAVTLCVGGGAEYVLVPVNASSVGASAGALAVEIDARGVTAAVAPPFPARAGAGAPMLPDERFHLRLREEARSSLAPRLRTLGGEPPLLRPSLAAAVAVPKVGDRLRLNVRSTGGDGCATPELRTGRVVAVTRSAVVVADSANPAGFAADEYRGFGETFDQLVYPLNVQTFGAPTDIDGNDRVILFFTEAVNRLTTAGSGFYVAGFFYDRDLFRKTGDGACAGSNEAELFYLMVPDARRAATEDAFRKESVREHTMAVLGHEFQHLINASRRLHVNKAVAWEEVWLNEGLSHIAEELLFYRAAGLSPRQNLTGAELDTPLERAAFRGYQLQNVDRYIRFLAQPQGASPLADNDDLATRGATWSFLRYAADRKNGDDTMFWRSLVDTRSAGVANLAAALGTDPSAWVQDWAVSVYADDAGLSTDARFAQPSWNFRALIPRLGDLAEGRNYGGYPLRTLRLADGTPARLQLRGGSAAYLRFGVPAETTAAIRTTSGGLPAPSTLRLALLRTR